MNYEWKKQGKENRDKVMGFIKKYIDVHGYAPTYSEIGKGCDIKTAYAVSRIMHKLFDDGYLISDIGARDERAWRLNDKYDGGLK